MSNRADFVSIAILLFSMLGASASAFRNAQTSQTNAVFEWVDGGSMDLMLWPTNEYRRTGYCMTQFGGEPYLNYYYPDCNLIAQVDGGQMANALAHEIGHYLGLTHNAGGAMSSCSAASPNCLNCVAQQGAIGNTEGQKAASCSQSPVDYNGGGSDEKEISENPDWEAGVMTVCERTIRVWTTYSCTSSGCSTYTNEEDLGTACYTYFL